MKNLSVVIFVFVFGLLLLRWVDPVLLFGRPVWLQIIIVGNAVPVAPAKLALTLADREHLRHMAVVADLGLQWNDLLVLGIP